MKQKRYRIAILMCLALFGMIATSSIIQTVIISVSARRSTAESYAEDCARITEAYALAVANKISEYMNQMRYYSDSDIVQTADNEAIVQWLREHTGARKGYFSSIIYSGLDGTAHADTGGSQNVSSQTFFTEIVNNGYTDYVDNPTKDADGSYVFHVARADKVRGSVIGVFAAVVPLRNIEDMIAYFRLGDSGKPWIVDEGGTVIASGNDSYTMKLNLLKSSSPSVADLAKKLTGCGIGTEWVSGLGSEKGRLFMAYTPIASTPWAFALSLSESQVYKTGRQLERQVVLILILAGIAVVLCALLMITRFVRPIKVVERTIEGIAEGNADLSQRIQVDSATEIGNVVDGFNRFTGKLQSIVQEIKKSKDELSSVGGKLQDSAEETSFSASEVLFNINTISEQIQHQSKSVVQTAGAVNEITANIKSLESMIEHQGQSVSQASRAVEEMIGNIDSVMLSVQKMATSFAGLAERANDGAKKQKNVNERIGQIEQESLALQEANSVIASIASQTNLLAMNAAIEAAHAGEAGQGFSVVADEIRKLSETSTAQSKTIGKQLKSIRQSISSVVEASAQSNEAFTAVAEEIRTTDSFVNEIKTAMEEQASGSKLISDSLTSMNDSTGAVRTASKEMNNGSKAILEEIHQLQDATDKIGESMELMRSSTEKINTTSISLNVITEDVKNSIEGISTQIDQFKV